MIAKAAAWLRSEPVMLAAVLGAVADALSEGLSPKQAVVLVLGAVARQLVSPTAR